LEIFSPSVRYDARDFLVAVLPVVSPPSYRTRSLQSRLPQARLHSSLRRHLHSLSFEEKPISSILSVFIVNEIDLLSFTTKHKMLSLLLGALAAAAVNALPTISAKGNKFFTSDGDQFFVKGQFFFSFWEDSSRNYMYSGPVWGRVALLVSIHI
jgi:hypothetical protein